MEAVGRVPNNLDKRDLVGFLFGGYFLLRSLSVRVTVLCDDEQGPNACDGEDANHGKSKLRCEPYNFSADSCTTHRSCLLLSIVLISFVVNARGFSSEDLLVEFTL
jgi:hypothetical protein